MEVVGALLNLRFDRFVNGRCWWRNSHGLLRTVLTVAYFDRLRVPRLS